MDNVVVLNDGHCKHSIPTAAPHDPSATSGSLTVFPAAGPWWLQDQRPTARGEHKGSCSRPGKRRGRDRQGICFLSHAMGLCLPCLPCLPCLRADTRCTRVVARPSLAHRLPANLDAGPQSSLDGTREGRPSQHRLSQDGSGNQGKSGCWRQSPLGHAMSAPPPTSASLPAAIDHLTKHQEHQRNAPSRRLTTLPPSHFTSPPAPDRIASYTTAPCSSPDNPRGGKAVGTGGRGSLTVAYVMLYSTVGKQVPPYYSLIYPMHGARLD